MADNHHGQQAEGDRLGLSQRAGGSDDCVDGSQNKQEGASENEAGTLLRFYLGQFQISELPLGELSSGGLFNQLVPGIKLQTHMN